MSTLDIRIAASANDCMRTDAGFAYTDGYEWLGQVNNGHGCAGERFLNVTIPQGSTITAAYITFTQEYNYTDTPCHLTTQGQAADNPASFAADTLSTFDARTRTTASVNWDAGGGAINSTFNSADISSVIQEIVNRAGWASGNAIVLFNKDNGSASGKYRATWSYDGSTTKCALLHIEYTPPVQGPSYTIIKMVLESKTGTGAWTAIQTTSGSCHGNATGTYANNIALTFHSPTLNWTSGSLYRLKVSKLGITGTWGSPTAREGRIYGASIQ